MNYAAIIYNKHNIAIRVEERPSKERAEMAGQFFTKFNSNWYKVVEGEDVELYKILINA